MAKPWNALVTSTMSVPNVFTLSLIATIAFCACAAAFCVSPESELTSAAEKLEACSMYWFALMPHVLKAFCACEIIVAEASP